MGGEVAKAQQQVPGKTHDRDVCHKRFAAAGAVPGLLLNSDPEELLWDSHPRAGLCVPWGWGGSELREPGSMEGFGCGVAPSTTPMWTL